MKFWNLISDKMDKVGLNKSRLSEMAGMSRATLNTLENGKVPSPDNRVKLETVFGYTIIKTGKDDYEWDAKIFDTQSEKLSKLKNIPTSHRRYKANEQSEIQSGLIEFKRSKDWMIAKISEEEEKWLEGIYFKIELNPSAEIYKDLLLIYRNLQ